MQILLLLGSALTALATQYDPMSDEFIDYINSLNTTWKAGRNFHHKTPPHFLRDLLGLLPSTPPKDKYLSESDMLRFKIKEIIPETFDSRIEWPHCQSISEIYDQGSCGSCWVFGAIGAMTDRICIHSNGTMNVQLSAEDLLSCCDYCGFGCQGGYPDGAWDYWVENGIVTGGAYHSNQGCKPYEIPPCEHHSTGPLPNCSKILPTPDCKKKCEESYSVSYKQDLHYGEKYYYIPGSESAIQREIMNNGPVEGTFAVYEDFFHYKKGVYHHVAGKSVGGHAIRIIGWGVEDETPYWLVVNSWNSGWGDKGYFKILRGKAECDIEDGVYAGIPKYN